MNKLALVDMSVMIYQTYFRHCKYYNEGRNKDTATIAFIELELVKLFQPGVSKDFTPILVFDKKDSDKVYWRQKFIEQHQEEHNEKWAQQGSIEDQAYKGGRLKPKDYSKLLCLTRLAAENLKEKYIFFEYPGLEADDLVALLCQYKNTDDFIDLLTVDRDWSGLVDDYRNIRWVNFLPKQRYKIETEINVVNYFKTKLDSGLEHPSECYQYKRDYGEVGDNLPKNCRIELIDLINHSAPISFGFQPAHDLIKDFYAYRSI
jgi:5'-3' exonuclease